MKREVRPALALAALLASGAGSAAGPAAPAKPVTPAPEQGPAAIVMPPVIKDEGSSNGLQRALDNYRKLLELPQAPEARADTQRRVADLQLQQVEAGGVSMEDGDKQLRSSIALYEQLLASQPQAPTNDRVLYQMSRAYQDLGDYAKADAALARMISEYPQSRYGDDAHFRRAELLYKVGRFDSAAAEYQYSLALSKDSVYFEPAQYKFGWCQHKLGHEEAALDNFLAILTRELPAGELSDPHAALEGVRAGKKDTAADSLRVIVLALIAKGGGSYLNQYFAGKTEPGFAPMLYVALADQLYADRRYLESADADLAFIGTHPKHALAPSFQARAIASYNQGGFTDRVVQAKERYVADYDPAAAYWGGQPAPADVLQNLRGNLEDLATYYHARGQKAHAKPDFAKASAYYKRILELFPNDAKATQINFLMAESYNEAGDTLAAAQQYDAVTAHKDYDKAQDAAYAAALAYHKRAGEVPDAEKPAALRAAVTAAVQLADRYPQHPQAVTLLTRAAEDLYQLQAWDEAVTVAGRVLAAQPEAPEALRRTALDVTADAQFGQKHYAEAATAYTQLLKLLPPKAAKERNEASEQLAQCLYKQGEAARAAGDLKGAAAYFQQVESATSKSSLSAASLFDAGAALIALKDWGQAATVLEKFRTAFPHHDLLPDVDKKLSIVYQADGKTTQAAAVLKRIAARTTEGADTRHDAAWLAVTLLDQAHDPRIAAEYEAYLKQYPQPLDAAMQSRKRLAELAGNDAVRRQHWLQEIVSADAAAGAARTPATRSMAAEAELEFGRRDAQAVARLPLKLPLKTSLAAKQQAMERAVATLTQAADYGIAEVTTAATYELGELYRQFGAALLSSEQPHKMSALVAEQYKLMLQDQAFPFEEKAIQYHESNLRRVAQGVSGEWIGRSLEALVQLAPGKYGKHEQNADIYEQPKLAANERYAHALGLMKAKQWNDAQAELVAWVKDFGSDAGGHANLGIAYVHTGRKDLATAELTQAGAMDPHNAVAFSWLGTLARESGDLHGAEQAYRRALDADPTNANAHLNLGVLYELYLQRPDDALKEYRAYQDIGGRDDPRAALWIADLQKQLAPAPARPEAGAATNGSGT